MDESKLNIIFVELYTTALKAATKNQWIQPPKEGSEKWQQLEAARKMVDEMSGDYGDFLRVQFSAMQRIGLVPSPHHLCSKNAVQRYAVYQKIKNKYHYKAYSVEGDEFVVHATGKRYPISQADGPIHQDVTATYAQHIANDDYKPRDTQEAVESLEYAIAKLKYKSKTPTERMLRALKDLTQESEVS